MNKTEKNTAVEQLEGDLARVQNAFVLGFSGLKVPDVTQLRQQVRETRSRYLVVKNTLALRAIKGGVLEPLSAHFTGPTAVAFNDDDPVALAKVLTAFARNNTAVQFKGAVVEGRVIPTAQIRSVAEIPGREELIARIVFLMQSPVRRLVSVLQGPVRNLAVVLSQIAEQKEKSAPAA